MFIQKVNKKRQQRSTIQTQGFRGSSTASNEETRFSRKSWRYVSSLLNGQWFLLLAFKSSLAAKVLTFEVVIRQIKFLFVLIMNVCKLILLPVLISNSMFNYNIHETFLKDFCWISESDSSTFLLKFLKNASVVLHVYWCLYRVRTVSFNVLCIRMCYYIYYILV